MDFSKLTNLLNDFPDLVKYAVALIVVLLLILIVSGILKKVTASVRIGGRKGARLKVLETTMIDSTRTLTLIRRDDIEHLIMMGGPNDLVIEADIGKNLGKSNLTAPIIATAPLAQPPFIQPPGTPPAHVAPVHSAPPPPPVVRHEAPTSPTPPQDSQTAGWPLPTPSTAQAHPVSPERAHTPAAPTDAPETPNKNGGHPDDSLSNIRPGDEK